MTSLWMCLKFLCQSHYFVIQTFFFFFSCSLLAQDVFRLDTFFPFQVVRISSFIFPSLPFVLPSSNYFIFSTFSLTHIKEYRPLFLISLSFCFCFCFCRWCQMTFFRLEICQWDKGEEWHSIFAQQRHATMKPRLMHTHIRITTPTLTLTPPFSF